MCIGIEGNAPLGGFPLHAFNQLLAVSASVGVALFKRFHEVILLAFVSGDSLGRWRTSSLQAGLSLHAFHSFS